MNRLSMLFEDDIELQDEIEDMDDLYDDSDSLQIGVIESRYADNKNHLLSEVEGPTEDELTALGILGDENLDVSALVAAEDEDEIIDDAIPEEDMKKAEKQVKEKGE